MCINSVDRLAKPVYVEKTLTDAVSLNETKFRKNS